MTTLTVRVDIPSSRVAQDWRSEARRTGKKCFESAAKAYAQEHGAAGVFRANDSYTLYYREDGKVRRKTWKNARILWT